MYCDQKVITTNIKHKGLQTQSEIGKNLENNQDISRNFISSSLFENVLEKGKGELRLIEIIENNTLYTPKASLKTGIKGIQDSTKRQKFSFKPHSVIM